jgi:hypothetical protein
MATLEQDCVINLQMTDVKRAIRGAKHLPKHPLSKAMLDVLNFKLFVMCKLQDGCNVVALIPALKNKLQNLCCKFLEHVEEHMEQKKMKEGKYLAMCKIAKEWHEEITSLLEILEYGLVIKCNII